MPHFKNVGYIDDNLTPAEIKKEYYRRYSLAAYHRRRAEIVTALGAVCATCGAGGPMTFVRKPDAPEFRVADIVTMSAVRRDRRLRWVQLLCETHASEVLYDKGQLTHGTYWAAFKKKCACGDCDQYKVAYNIRRRENRRAAKADASR